MLILPEDYTGQRWFKNKQRVQRQNEPKDNISDQISSKRRLSIVYYKSHICIEKSCLLS